MSLNGFFDDNAWLADDPRELVILDCGEYRDGGSKDRDARQEWLTLGA